MTIADPNSPDNWISHSCACAARPSDEAEVFSSSDPRLLRQLLREAYLHNSHARDQASCNVPYMGSLATHSLTIILRGSPGRLLEAIDNAPLEQLRAGVAYCWKHGYLRHINPRQDSNSMAQLYSALPTSKQLQRLIDHLAEQPPFKPDFNPGDIVRLDTGAFGIVLQQDPIENTTTVFYIDPDTDEIRGPAYGFELELLPV